MRILVLFLIGFFLDMLATLDMIAVYQKEAMRSGVISFIITIFSLGVAVNICITKSNQLRKWIEIISYALGGAIGAYLTIRFNR